MMELNARSLLFPNLITRIGVSFLKAFARLFLFWFFRFSVFSFFISFSSFTVFIAIFDGLLLGIFEPFYSGFYRRMCREEFTYHGL